MIHITSDSTTDLGELYEKRGIKTLPLAVVLGKDTYEDGVTVHPNDIYDFVAKNKVLPKTAARSVEEHREFFASILKSDEDSIVHFTISSKLSVTYQNAVAAAKEFKNVYVVDTYSLSSGGGLLTLYACDLRDEDKYSAKEIYEKCLARVPFVEASFFVDTMDYLYKGGRCSGLASFFATALKLKPSLVLVDGKSPSARSTAATRLHSRRNTSITFSKCSPTPTPRVFHNAYLRFARGRRRNPFRNREAFQIRRNNRNNRVLHRHEPLRQGHYRYPLYQRRAEKISATARAAAMGSLPLWLL